MTQTQTAGFENKQGNLLGVTKIQTADGSAKAVVSTRRITVNTNPVIRETNSGNGWFLSFMTNVYGDFSIKALKYGLNNPIMQESEYGISVKVSIFIRSKAQKEYFEKTIVKGAKIDGLHGTISMDPKFGVQYSVQSNEIGFIHKPEGHTASAANEEVPFDSSEDAGEGKEVPSNFRI